MAVALGEAGVEVHDGLLLLGEQPVVARNRGIALALLCRSAPPAVVELGREIPDQVIR